MGITLAVSLLYFLQILSVWTSCFFGVFILLEKKEYCLIQVFISVHFLMHCKMGSFNALIFELTSKVYAIYAEEPKKNMAMEDSNESQ